MSAATPADVPALAALMEEMGRFYGDTVFEPLARRIAQIEQALFGPRAVADVLLVRNTDEPVGFASYTFLWPAVGVTSSLYLKELYIARSHRGHGLGTLLMSHVAAVAVRHDCTRMEWATGLENRDAQEFYRSLSATVHAGKVSYRLGPAEISTLSGLARRAS
ncbi:MULTISPECIES: GNAT family N-acetyltransferase [Polymorphospora]|uniref:GNAT family N-acetyltransferase n=1 Tax=Polymorphospora lycopeni TaxID=3140240 RepID=A0ABV5CY98_9ACTN